MILICVKYWTSSLVILIHQSQLCWDWCRPGEGSRDPLGRNHCNWGQHYHHPRLQPRWIWSTHHLIEPWQRHGQIIKKLQLHLPLQSQHSCKLLLLQPMIQIRPEELTRKFFHSFFCQLIQGNAIKFKIVEMIRLFVQEMFYIRDKDIIPRILNVVFKSVHPNQTWVFMIWTVCFIWQNYKIEKW